jgi:polar amino acid transport system substrate-binding protein
MNRKTKFCYVFFIIILSLFIINSTSQAESEKEIRVGISEFDPFVTSKETGFSIDLWKAVAEEAGISYRFVKGSFHEKLANLKNDKTDIGIGGISVNSGREKIYDFSMPTFDSGLTILVKKTATKNKILPLIAKNLFTWEIAKLMMILFALLVFWGFLLWFVERGSDVIRDKFSDGFQDAIWCSWAIKTTIGFGDIYPKKILGRLLTVPIFFSGVAMLGVVTAPINTAFVIRDIDTINSRINSPDDLKGKKVATKAKTYCVAILEEYDAQIIETATITEAYKLLHAGEVEAVVYDAPALIRYTMGHSDVTLAGKMFAKHHYAFAFQQGSDELQKVINHALLVVREKGIYENILHNWFDDK